MPTFTKNKKVFHLPVSDVPRSTKRLSFTWRAVAVMSVLPALRYSGMYPPWYLCLTLVGVAGAICCENSSILVHKRLNLLERYKEGAAIGYMFVAITWTLALSFMQWGMMSASLAQTHRLTLATRPISTVIIYGFWGLFAFSLGWTSLHVSKGRRAWRKVESSTAIILNPLDGEATGLQRR
jgi:hypothetical protein